VEKGRARNGKKEGKKKVCATNLFIILEPYLFIALVSFLEMKAKNFTCSLAGNFAGFFYLERVSDTKKYTMKSKPAKGMKNKIKVLKLTRTFSSVFEANMLSKSASLNSMRLAVKFSVFLVRNDSNNRND
jgi:hypothetical protein